MKRDADRNGYDLLALALLNLLETDIVKHPENLIPLDGELADLMSEFAELDDNDKQGF